MRFRFTNCVVFIFVAAAAAQTEEEALRCTLESKRQVTEYMRRSARAITDRANDEIRTVASWEKVEGQRREELREMLGLLPWPERTPLHVGITGTLDQGSYIIEKIAFQSLPQFYVTANLYLPKDRARPLPAIVYACGHKGSPYGGKFQYQRHGISLAKNGYAALVLDPIQNAEAFSFHHGVIGEELFDWYARGYTPGGVETWNAIRAIDYLETRPEVDKTRIGMTGFSGGAVMTYFTAAVDPRVKAAAPFMGITTYDAILREGAEPVHCDCMLPINAHLQDLIHIGGLIAPRPLLMAQGKKDIIFPVTGYMEFARNVGALYRAYQRPDAFRLLELNTGHEDSDYNREQAIRWFDRHLMGIPERKLDMSYTDLPGPALVVFPNGPPADAQNFRVHETFVPRAPLRRYSTVEAWESRRQQLLALLRSKVFPKIPEHMPGARMEKAPVSGTLPKNFEEYRITSEATVPVRALLRKGGPRQPLLLHIASDGLDTAALVRPVPYGMAVPWGWPCMVLLPRGVGEMPWNKTFWRATLRNSMMLGETVDSMRLADVLVAVEALYADPEVAPDGIVISGQGVAGALALYAAILDPRIRQVVLADPPVTHVVSPIFLNVLRYTDLPEAAALIAPRPLQFYMRLPEAYEYTRHIYQLYGKLDRFSRVFKVALAP